MGRVPPSARNHPTYESGATSAQLLVDGGHRQRGFLLLCGAAPLPLHSESHAGRCLRVAHHQPMRCVLVFVVIPVHSLC